MAKKQEYIPKAVTTSISATSRISLKVNDSYYTVEYTEERRVPEDCDIVLERKALWDTVNEEVDNQAMEIYNMNKK